MADRRSLSSRITPFWGAAFLLAVALLLGAGGIAVWQYVRFAEATESVQRAHNVRILVDSLASRVNEAETGHRGYLLTHDSRFLRPYDNVTAETRRLSDELRVLVGDDPAQRQRAAELDRLIVERADEMARVLAIDRDQGAASAVAHLAAGRGRELMEEIRDAATQMAATERTRLASRGREAELARAAALGFAIFSILLAGGVGFLGWSVGHAFSARRAELQGELARREAAEASAAEAADQLQAAADLNERILESSADCVAVLRADGTVTSINGPGLRLLGLPSIEAVVGRDWPALWGTEEPQASRAVFDALSGSEGRFVSRLDSGKWFDVIVTPLHDVAGTPTRLVSTARDVTEQHRAQQWLADSELRFRTLADMVPQIVFTATADGRPDYFNQGWYEYSGATPPPGPRAPAAADGKAAADCWGPYLHAADRDGALRAWSHSVQQGTPFQVQCRYKRADGAYRWFMARALPLRGEGGHVVRWFGTCTDVDDQKRVDEERSQLLASERTARAEAERAARLKDEFVSTLSHELRTPLNAMAGWIQVLQHDRRPDTLDKGLAVIDRNLKRQAQMIDQLLDMSRIVSGKMRLDIGRVRFGAVIDEAVRSVQAMADVKGVQLNVATRAPLDVRGDSARLQQVVWNLLLNAVKFSRTGDTVEVVLRQENAYAVLEVRDVGQGIAPEFLPQLFQRFRQADASSTRRHAGLGLGLAIVKNLVEMHGGVVQAASEGLEKGATFTIRLPLAPPEPGAVDVAVNGSRSTSPAPPDGGVLEGLVVLVVDDEPDARELLQHCLESAGARTALATSVDDAMDVLSHADVPDIIVSDIGLPDRDGYEFMRRVRRLRGPVAEVPAAAVTALSCSDDRRRALMAGYQTHLAKPIDENELVAVVATLAGRAGRVGNGRG
jgi:PAS domain S-box-containing protein